MPRWPEEARELRLDDGGEGPVGRGPLERLAQRPIGVLDRPGLFEAALQPLALPHAALQSRGRVGGRGCRGRVGERQEGLVSAEPGARERILDPLPPRRRSIGDAGTSSRLGVGSRGLTDQFAGNPTARACVLAIGANLHAVPRLFKLFE